jgi:hypothetical protein
MARLKSLSDRASTVDSVKKIPAILGCIVLLFSFTFPFFYGAFSALSGGGETSFWSYRAESQSYFQMYSNLENFWLTGYWFSSNWQTPFKVVITGIFIIQILTLAFGLASVIFNRRLQT